MKTVRIGTRGSALALWQANTVADALTERAGVSCELVIIRTSGDEPPNAPPTGAASTSTLGPSTSTSGTLGTSTPGTPSTVSAKATFVKEIEDALLDRRIDIAVHSSKDLSAVFPSGLIIGATLPRDDPRDALLLPRGETVASLDHFRIRVGGAPRFGTSSVRRIAQLNRLFPGATFVGIRGNVGTRLRKLDNGECDAGMLASAGLKRLGLAHRISLALPLDDFVSAPGQGIVAIQIREDQQDVQSMVATINDADAFDALLAERAVVDALGGGCQMPLGAHARLEADRVMVVGLVIAPNGRRTARAEATGERASAGAVGRAVAESLIRQGAAEIIRSA